MRSEEEKVRFRRFSDELNEVFRKALREGVDPNDAYSCAQGWIVGVGCAMFGLSAEDVAKEIASLSPVLIKALAKAGN